MFGLGIGELMVILLIVVVVFGAGRIGDVGGDLGRAIRNFRKALNEPDSIDVTPKDGEAKKTEAEKK
ncbi:MAG TPA: twin-arginine translocase TatA/TatE family subunit [Candidatus Binatia bacterium]|jgi:sec-independent protein translocase protein TatA|nr:twin-arginine translocase TatA/TatE family subunit [Candidatus Binatia bacterium]